MQYTDFEDLQPFDLPPSEAFGQEVLKALSADDVRSADWAAQFQALDDARRLVRHVPKLIVADRARLKKLVALVVALADSLRSTLAKNALRCLGELFLLLGPRMDSELDGVLAALLRRAADTNAFISDEAEATLVEAMRAGTEARLMQHVQAAATHRRPELRARAAWCLAMLAQRAQVRGGVSGQRDLRVIADAGAKALGDANADVRQAARLIAVALVAGPGLEDCSSAARIQAAVPTGLEASSFDAFDLEQVRRTLELGRAGGGLCATGRTQRR